MSLLYTILLLIEASLNRYLPSNITVTIASAFMLRVRSSALCVRAREPGADDAGFVSECDGSYVVAEPQLNEHPGRGMS
jgi:hypothetical protein